MHLYEPYKWKLFWDYWAYINRNIRVGIEIKNDGAFIRFVSSTNSKASRDIHISKATNRLNMFYTDFSWREIR